MLYHFFKVLFRTSLKNSSYALLNISGLVIGMTAFALISLYIWHERSYDQFHSNKDQIFRIQEDDFAHGSLESQSIGVGAAVGKDIKDNFPEVNRFVRLRRNQVMLSNGDIMFKEDRVFFASEDFFMMFSFPLIKGVDSLVLKDPFTMAVSESFARKYFGEEDPIGKFLKNNGSEEYQITGVFKDVPENTHLQVDALFSFNSLYPIFGPDGIEYLTNWGWVGYPTYIELHPSADPQLFKSKLPKLIEEKMGTQLKGMDGAMIFNLQPLTSIHLNSNFNHEISPNGNGRTINFLTLIAILILGMAWVNYVNMATARSLERAKEVGIRKVLGSNRGQLVRQFLLESFVFNAVALFLSFILVMLLLPYFRELVERQFAFSELNLRDTYLFLFGVLFCGVIASGLYPSIAISGFKPAGILKGKFQSSASGIHLRKGMVLAQFVVSIILIIGTSVIYSQLNFMQNSPLGVNIEQVLVVSGPTVRDSTYSQKFDVFRNGLLSYPDISEVTASSVVPGRGSRNGSGGVRLASQSESKSNSCDVAYVDEDFIETFDLIVNGGRNFSQSFKDEEKSVLLNEAALRMIGYTEPEKVTGEQILVYGDTLSVVGVIKDYHHQSLKNKVEPLIFICSHNAATFYSIKINTKESPQAIISRTEMTYKQSFAGNPFNYFFLDDYYNEQYKTDMQFGKVFNLFTAIAIIIACLGLFGLSSYSVVQRTKEIGIRKVLGASLGQIGLLVSKDFIMIVLLANAISIPIAYLLMDSWLNGFANRINLGVLSFILPSIFTLALAILTVASQAIKAANADPVKNLRTE
jgi:putative ABC transport system permease protein